MPFSINLALMLQDHSEDKLTAMTNVNTNDTMGSITLLYTVCPHYSGLPATVSLMIDCKVAKLSFFCFVFFK